MPEYLQEESTRLCKKYKVETIDEVIEIQKKLTNKENDIPTNQ